MSMAKIHRRCWLEAIWQGGAILLLASVIGLTVNQLRPGKLPLVADWSPKARLTLPKGDSLEISLDEAERLFRAKAAVFLDARSPDWYEEGHIEGALSLPRDEVEDRFSSIMAAIPPETLTVTYCDGETCNLSKELALALMEKGYTNVRVLVNGWTVWQERNLPVETGGELS